MAALHYAMYGVKVTSHIGPMKDEAVAFAATCGLKAKLSTVSVRTGNIGWQGVHGARGRFLAWIPTRYMSPSEGSEGARLLGLG